MKSTLTTVLALSVVATAVAQDRKTAKASFDEGAVTISYGSPTWRDAFSKAMAEQKTWRLGANAPTSVNLTCGLMTDSGCIPAGDYKMAAQRNDKGDWNLVVYKGDGFFDEGLPAWTIAPANASKSDKTSDSLEIMVSDKKELAVHFGPHKSVYSLQPVKMLEPVKAEFARIPTTVNVMAVPINQGVKNLFVGTASCERSGQSVTWDLYLTIESGSGILDFKNTRAKEIGAERKSIEATIKRVSGMLESADADRKERIETYLADQKKLMKELGREAAMLESFKTSQMVKGMIKKNNIPGKKLTFEGERIDGGMILKFGAGEQHAEFRVTPRDFLNRRR